VAAGVAVTAAAEGVGGRGVGVASGKPGGSVGFSVVATDVAADAGAEVGGALMVGATEAGWQPAKKKSPNAKPKPGNIGRIRLNISVGMELVIFASIWYNITS
jgi:hypothetical protein